MNGRKKYRNKLYGRQVTPKLIPHNLNIPLNVKSFNPHPFTKPKNKLKPDDFNLPETPYREGSAYYTYLQNYKYCPYKNCRVCKVIDPQLYKACHSGYRIWDKETRR